MKDTYEQTLIQGEADYARLAPPDPDPLPEITRTQVVWNGNYCVEVSVDELKSLIRRATGELRERKRGEVSSIEGDANAQDASGRDPSQRR